MKHGSLKSGSSYAKAAMAHLTCIAVVSVSACVAIAPQFMAPSFEPSKIDILAVLPAVDARIDDSIDLGEGWEKEIESYGINSYWSTARHFKRKGYDCRFADSYGAIGTIDAAELAAPTPEFVRQLGEEDERWIFVFVLDDLACKGEPFLSGISCAAECSAVLFDKEEGVAVWRHSARIESGAVGGFGLALVSPKRSTVKRCVSYEVLYKQFPKRSGSRFR